MRWLWVFRLIALSLILFVADALLKAYVHLYIPVMYAASPIYPYDGIAVFQDWGGIDFSIVHVINRGAAWGIFASMQQYLLYARLALVGGLLIYLSFVKKDRLHKFFLTLVVTGALGNIADSFVYGHVIDMFYFVFWGYSYPVFNIADSVIFCGIAGLVCRSFFKTSPKTAAV